MKIRMTRGYRVYEVYDTIELDPNDYPELEGLSDEEVVSYLNENLYEFSVKDADNDNLYDEFIFEKDIIKDKQFDDECEVVLITE